MNQIIKHQPPEYLAPDCAFCADCNMIFYADLLACPGCDKPIPPAPPIAQILNSGHPGTGKLELIYTGAEVAKLMNCPLFETVERVVLRIPPSAIAKTFIRKGFEQNRQKAAGPDQPAERPRSKLLGRREAADYLGFTLAQFDLAKGDIPHKPTKGGHGRWRAADLDGWMNSGFVVQQALEPAVEPLPPPRAKRRTKSSGQRRPLDLD